MNAPCRSALGCCPCPHPCDQADVNSILLQYGESFRFRKGDVLWNQDEPARRIIGVCIGALKLVRTWPGGRQPVLDLVFRGGVAGEASALHGARYAETCVAIAPGRGVELSAERLQRMLPDRPELAETLLSICVDRQHAFGQRLDELANGPVEDRLARVLLRIGDEVGLTDARGIFIPVKLSRGDLAEMVGCRVETAIRVLTRWQRQGKVETRPEGLVIRDRGGLAEAALPA